MQAAGRRALNSETKRKYNDEAMVDLSPVDLCSVDIQRAGFNANTEQMEIPY
jgi:hypothetical protein